MTKAEKRALETYPGEQKENGVARFFFADGYEQAIKDIIEDSIPATVWTWENPKNILTNSEKWNELLGRFENGEHVRLALMRVYSQDSEQ